MMPKRHQAQVSARQMGLEYYSCCCSLEFGMADKFLVSSSTLCITSEQVHFSELLSGTKWLKTNCVNEVSYLSLD